MRKNLFIIFCFSLLWIFLQLAEAASDIKIHIDRDGMYTVTYGDLQSAGLDPSVIDPRTVKISNQGNEIAIYVYGEEDGIFDTTDYIEFYGAAIPRSSRRENPVLFHNLKAYLQGESLQEFDPGGDYLLIFNLGNGQGVLRKKWFQISGNFAFRIKDWIDRKFMAEFQ